MKSIIPHLCVAPLVASGQHATLFVKALKSNVPRACTCPLQEMVDFLQEAWSEEGLYG